jgi:hypothetical protein
MALLVLILGEGKYIPAIVLCIVHDTQLANRLVYQTILLCTLGEAFGDQDELDGYSEWAAMIITYTAAALVLKAIGLYLWSVKVILWMVFIACQTTLAPAFKTTRILLRLATGQESSTAQCLLWTVISVAYAFAFFEWLLKLLRLVVFWCLIPFLEVIYTIIWILQYIRSTRARQAVMVEITRMKAYLAERSAIPKIKHPLGPLEKYLYEPLDETHDEIRLLFIQRRVPFTPISRKLIQAKLEEAIS